MDEEKPQSTQLWFSVAVGTYWVSSGTRMGEKAWNEPWIQPWIFQAAQSRLDIVLFFLTPNLPSSHWLKACLKLETLQMSF